MTTSVTKAPDRSAQLGCGRDIDDVWDNVNRPPTDHEVSCPDCQAARASLTVLAETTTEANTQDQTDPDLVLDASALDRIRSIVRSEVRRGNTLQLLQPGTGPTGAELTISEQSVAAVVRAAADQVTGLEARRCQVVLYATSGSAVEHRQPLPSGVTITLGVAAHLGVSIPTATADLRARIADAVTARVGLSTVAIHIGVEDLLDV